MRPQASLTSSIVAITRLHAREQRGQMSRRARVLASTTGILFVALGSYHLHSSLASWQGLRTADGHSRLWLLMLSGWISISVVAALATLQTALHRQDIANLVPMPLDDGTRWRLVLMRVASRFGPVLALGMLSLAFSLSRFGFAWALTFLLWIPAAMCLGVLMTLYVAWLSGNGSPRGIAIALTLLVPTVVAMTLLFFAARSPGQALSPLAMIPDAVLIPALVCGPGARRLGRWYLDLVQERYLAPAKARDFLGPLSAWLGVALSRYRVPWAALALKELRVQARDVFLLLRIVVMLGALPLYIATHGLLADRDIHSSALIAVYALVLATYCAIETTPSPFGGEGNRLTLALLCPVSTGSLIAGKTVAVVVPLVMQLWVMLASMGMWSRSDVVDLVAFGASVTVAVVAIGVIITCLSVHDIDLRTPVDGTTQAMLVEHVPNRPIRMLNIAVALMLASGTALVVIRLPWLASTLAIMVAGAGLAFLAYRNAARVLGRLVPA